MNPRDVTRAVRAKHLPSDLLRKIREGGDFEAVLSESFKSREKPRRETVD